MRIRCWGSRGSIPVSGREYLKYGGDTTCIEVETKTGHSIVIDAGTGIRKLGETPYFKSVREFHLLFTHCHLDHVIGFNFFTPLFLKNRRIIIPDNRFGQTHVQSMVKTVLKPPLFPITLENVKADIEFTPEMQDSLIIGSVTVETIPLSHPGGGLGYKFTEDGKTFAFITDNEPEHPHPGGMNFQNYTDFVKNADILFHDAEFTSEEYQSRMGWGHSSIPAVLRLAVEAGVGRLGLFHINQKRSDTEMDRLVEDAGKDLLAGNSSIECFAVPGGMEIHL